jgi:Vault protein inter-alpha-trypsin domain
VCPEVCNECFSACRFESKVGERLIRTETKRKAKAEAEFASTVAQGHTAVILKQKVSIQVQYPGSMA